MQLKTIHTLKATLVLQTGLHIGAGDGEMHIGGTDNPVIKHPYSNHPYIPGSSLKGKIRSLLEWRSGMVQEKPLGLTDWQHAKEPQKSLVMAILRLFGVSGGDQIDVETAKQIGPTRLAFWDCSLQPAWVDEVGNLQMLTEVKSENVINRISGTAQHPRQTERVPAGARFDFRLSIKSLDQDNNDLLQTLLVGLRLLELDSLGGGGSRGNGKVVFENITLDGASIELPADPFKLGE